MAVTDPPRDGTEHPESLGECLRRHRQAANLSLADLARRVNYSRGYLSKVETGRAPGNLALARRCDQALATGGALAALMRHASPAAPPDPAPAGPPARAPASDRPTADRPGAETALPTSAPLPPGLASGVAFMLALDATHGALRRVAGDDLSPPRRYDAANRAVHDAALYVAREQLLVSATVPVVAAGEAAFLRLIAIRDAIRTGAALASPEYHAVYHPFAESLWTFRMALRQAFGQEPVTPALLDRIDWSDRERCADCGAVARR
ncbi:Helix-turn-helix domain-containing protein [Micromonospora echinospora]|uniref:Helix-turn-helix domain-containing protein n=1 Tax=Micromonospora echinospora TaxID=1877 RepID=A0A1C4ZRF2_MICEC|nr:Helix-turn-helix domain-containing protein [Micromonospora echinospora]